MEREGERRWYNRAGKAVTAREVSVLIVATLSLMGCESGRKEAGRERESMRERGLVDGRAERTSRRPSQVGLQKEPWLTFNGRCRGEYNCAHDFGAHSRRNHHGHPKQAQQGHWGHYHGMLALLGFDHAVFSAAALAINYQGSYAKST